VKESALGHWNAASVGKRTWRGKGSEGNCSRKETVIGACGAQMLVTGTIGRGRSRDRESYDITVNHGKSSCNSTR